MEIRFAQAVDVPGILSLLRQVGQVHHAGRPDIFRAGAQKYGASQVLGMLNKSESPIFVAVEENQVLGYCFCQIHSYQQDPVRTDRTELYIDDLCVDENRRRQQVGQQLYAQVCRYAKMRRCDAITLNVWSCNPTAIAFYEKLGLVPQKVCMEMQLGE